MSTTNMVRAAAGAVLLLLPIAAAAPAWAGFGAVAYDDTNGRYGASFNQPSETQAFEKALKQCSSAGCRVHVVEPRGCGALALSNRDKAWGGADRVTLAAAEHAAVAHCQIHTKTGICTVRVFGCNK
ncbi:MAG TPA: DUF4189 domain-containing protein [Stellaceae bacterium]|nr:DUF4189 domain-containing protein [Stellaceae bacterium]